jgi:hypothetical protein
MYDMNHMLRIKLIILNLFILSMHLYVFKIIELHSIKRILAICTLFCDRSKPFKCPASNGIHARLIVEPRIGFNRIKTKTRGCKVLTGLFYEPTRYGLSFFFLACYLLSRPRSLSFARPTPPAVDRR